MTTMIELVNEYDQGGKLTGGVYTDLVAQEWEAAGFTVDNVADWWDAGCWCPTSTAELRDAGLTPEDVAAKDRNGISLGYAYCNKEITLNFVKKLLMVKDIWVDLNRWATHKGDDNDGEAEAQRTGRRVFG